jgi:hypothetical protein
MDHLEQVLALKDTKHLEVEFRIGRKNKSFFDTNIGSDHFEKVLRRLSRFPGWESPPKTEVVEIYYGKREGLRVIYDPETENQTCIIKKNLKLIDITLPELYDVRIALSSETPGTYEPEVDEFVIKKRTRTSFTRKGLRIDCSIVEGTADDKDSEVSKSYQIELEILDPKSLDRNLYTNHYAKISDVLKLCA